MIKEGAYHLPLFLLTRENMDAYKPFPVVNIPPVSFIGGPTKQGRTGNIKGDWVPDRSEAVVMAVVVPVEVAL